MPNTARRRSSHGRPELLIPPGGSTSLWNSGTSLAPFDGGRSAKSYFAELKVPVVKNVPGLHLVTLDGAFRHESFSDGNTATVPKVSLAWLPFDDQLRLRATYGKSFSEPTLYELYGPVSAGFTNDLSNVRAYDSSGNPTGDFIGFQGHSMGGSNPNLTPSHAKSYTFGFIYSPKWAKGLDITVDYFHIEQNRPRRHLGYRPDDDPGCRALRCGLAIRPIRRARCVPRPGWCDRHHLPRPAPRRSRQDLRVDRYRQHQQPVAARL
ncbi:MAG: TonB-dependent receptor [Lacunisphaera sp.]